MTGHYTPGGHNTPHSHTTSNWSLMLTCKIKRLTVPRVPAVSRESILFHALLHVPLFSHRCVTSGCQVRHRSVCRPGGSTSIIGLYKLHRNKFKLFRLQAGIVYCNSIHVLKSSGAFVLQMHSLTGDVSVIIPVDKYLLIQH